MMRVEAEMSCPRCHALVRNVVCFVCYRADRERPTSTPMGEKPQRLPAHVWSDRLSPRQVAHRQRMLTHLGASS